MIKNNAMGWGGRGDDVCKKGAVFKLLKIIMITQKCFKAWLVYTYHRKQVFFKLKTEI